MSSRLIHGVVLTTASVAAAAALAACGTSPSGTPRGPVSTSPAAASTAAAPAWQATFSPAQIAAYDAAVTRWKAYQVAANAIYAAGQDTPGAEATFKEYTAFAPVLIGELQRQAAAGVVDTAFAKPIWVKAASIHGTTSLQLEECDDISLEAGTKNGKPVPWHPKTRYALTTVDMSLVAGGWLIYTIDATQTPCVPTL